MHAWGLARKTYSLIKEGKLYVTYLSIMLSICHLRVFGIESRSHAAQYAMTGSKMSALKTKWYNDMHWIKRLLLHMKQASSAEKQSCPSLYFQGGTGTQGISRSLCKRDRQRYLLRVLVCHPPCVSRYLKPNFFLSVQCSFFVLVVSLKT